ncbi:HEAT repeat domain-containing protein [Duganella vulcania]|uniref:HEAT repeat domain-containing protein n=1 Tax=Duganella vulcania TaxID=2692166 RepID=A0A845GFY8_9BURK|nr:HEAT repeat domain-containing protein [Duganella vulcania]MYM92312.1 HEAT repeat domain-containing protein [Duganella vulcania]
MSDGFCTHCFTLLPALATACPVCGNAQNNTGEGDYREKVVSALRHPSPEVRVRAIVAIGLMHDKSAADALVACALRNPADVVVGLQIIETLKIIDDGKPRMTALRYLHARHPDDAIKQAAQVTLNAILPAPGA